MVPFGTVGLVGEDKLGLLGIGVLGFLLEVVILLLKDILLAFELTLHLVDLSISVSLDYFKVLLDSITLLLDSFDLLFKATMLRHHALGAKFKPFIKCILFLFEFTNSVLKLIDLT